MNFYKNLVFGVSVFAVASAWSLDSDDEMDMEHPYGNASQQQATSINADQPNHTQPIHPSFFATDENEMGPDVKRSKTEMEDFSDLNDPHLSDCEFTTLISPKANLVNNILNSTLHDNKEKARLIAGLFNYIDTSMVEPLLSNPEIDAFSLMNELEKLAHNMDPISYINALLHQDYLPYDMLAIILKPHNRLEIIDFLSTHKNAYENVENTLKNFADVHNTERFFIFEGFCKLWLKNELQNHNLDQALSNLVDLFEKHNLDTLSASMAFVGLLMDYDRNDLLENLDPDNDFLDDELDSDYDEEDHKKWNFMTKLRKFGESCTLDILFSEGAVEPISDEIPVFATLSDFCLKFKIFEETVDLADDIAEGFQKLSKAQNLITFTLDKIIPDDETLQMGMLTSFIQSNPLLKTITLNFNNQITDSNLQTPLFQTLKAHPSLTTLHISGIDPSESLLSLLVENPNLKLLNLEIDGSYEFFMLANALETNTTLQSLRISATIENFSPLSFMLSRNKALREVSFENSTLDSIENAKQLNMALKINKTLEVLDLSLNQINDEMCKILADALQYNSGLEELKLRENEFSDNGALHLFEALKMRATPLRYLDLRDNKLTKNRWSEIIKALKELGTSVFM